MTRVGLVVHRTFHAVSHSRNFRLFFIGQAVSVTGTWMQSVAAAWLVLQLARSHAGLALGLLAALNFGPMLFLGAFGGLLADRRDKRSILIATQSIFAVLALALWALVAANVVQLWMVYALTLLQGMVTAIDMPARQSFYVEMVGQAELTNAISLNSAVMTGTRIIGPALAGILIATIGLAPCFLVNAVSYAAVIVGLRLMRPLDLQRTRAERRKGQLREGLAYVWRTAELRDPLVWMAFVFAFSFNFSILFPLLAKDVFGGDAGTLGLLLSLLGVGSLLGALVMARQEHPNPRRLALGSAAFGLASIVVAFAPTLLSELVLLVPMGFVSMVFMITGNSTLQLTSRPDMRGRVMALYGIVFLGSTPIGGPIAGWAAEQLGPRWALALGGAIAVLVGVAGMWAVSKRRVEARRPDPRPAEPDVVPVPVGVGVSPQLATDDAVMG
ncbi:MAG TPA: MFS transporter [Actinomycetota bacterium]